MNKTLIINDFKKNKLITIVTTIFMALSAMLISVSVLLFTGLLGSINLLMTTAKSCDFLQMHAGEIDAAQIEEWAEDRDDISDYGIFTFLNIDNTLISINGKSFVGNTQDNGLCTQGDGFDYLLGMDNEILNPTSGQIFVPACYRDEYKIKPGDRVCIGHEVLEIAGFLRDSQMNSMMASSKRFLVSQEDYDRLRELGSEEYLIEFRFLDGTDVNDFSKAYIEAGLPNNGPTITAGLIKMMNALSDGMMIFIILLVAFVVLVISIICIRFIILADLEKEKKEIGMMKALGIAKADIRRIYLSKYLILSLLGATIGEILAIVISSPLSKQMRELYGAVEQTGTVIIMSLIGVALTELAILFSIIRCIVRFEKISVVEALFGRTAGDRKRRKYTRISAVITAVVFMVLIPMNVNSTISDPDFVRYMGIGDGQIRIDIRESGASSERDANESIKERATRVCNDLSLDSRVKRYALYNTSNLLATLPNKEQVTLLCEEGDHSAFPVKYSQGHEPISPDEIALSSLNAKDLRLTIGDKIELTTGDHVATKKVCGIYSDITNGGKTAKKYKNQSSESDIMWSIIYISLEEGQDLNAWLQEYQESYRNVDSGISLVDIKTYVESTYSQTMSQISLTSKVINICGILVIFTVVILFMRLNIWQDRRDISLQKALGLTEKEIKNGYTKSLCIYILIGVVIGQLLGIFLGQIIANIALSGFGADGFRFIINYLEVLIIVPVFAAATGLVAGSLALKEIDKVKAYECFRGCE